MEQPVITNIQHFSVGDGPGIRTTVFFKGCNLHCPWCHNPENIAPDIDAVYGRMCTVEETVAEIGEDLDFYRESGGGVTLSGGEPLLQARVCREIARACKERGIPVLLDTAGNVGFSAFEEVLPYLDECYFDLKAGTEAGYGAVGGSLGLTLSNMRALTAWGIPTVVRIPVIPGFNDSEETGKAMADALAGISIKRVDLLPFHRLGSAKYKELGLSYAYARVPGMEPEKLLPLLAIFESAGFRAAVGG